MTPPRHFKLSLSSICVHVCTDAHSICVCSLSMLLGTGLVLVLIDAIKAFTGTSQPLQDTTSTCMLSLQWEGFLSLWSISYQMLSQLSSLHFFRTCRGQTSHPPTFHRKLSLCRVTASSQICYMHEKFQDRPAARSTQLCYCRGVSPADYGPNGGAAFDDLLMHLMEAHQPAASPTSRDTLASLPRRKVSSAAAREVFSNTPNDLPAPAACGCGEPCSVCHDSLEEGTEVVELPCQHCYHEECITAWLKDVSPVTLKRRLSDSV